MAEPTQPEAPAGGSKDKSASTRRGRRRLLQGGLGASPLLLTLVSRPVLGHDQCFTPSGFVSAPTSQHGEPKACLGRTPGYWKQPQKFGEWPLPYVPVTTTGPGGKTATLFKTLFPRTPYPANTTFLQVLEMQGGPPDNVARHIVAAVLNVAKGFTPVLTIPQIQRIWDEYMLTGGGTIGYFEPSAGVRWNQAQIVEYLTTTMPV